MGGKPCFVRFLVIAFPMDGVSEWRNYCGDSERNNPCNTLCHDCGHRVGRRRKRHRFGNLGCCNRQCDATSSSVGIKCRLVPTQYATTSSSPTPGMSPAAPNGRVGIPFVFSNLGTVTQANTTKTYPKLNNATFEMQAQIGIGGPWKTYQKWAGCTVNISSVTSAFDTYAGVDWTGASNYDPEYVLLDPRTMRFGVWETRASATADTSDYTRGYNEALEKSAGVFKRSQDLAHKALLFPAQGRKWRIILRLRPILISMVLGAQGTR